MSALLDRITGAAHRTAARLAGMPLSIEGHSVDAVQLDSWEGASELVPGYRQGTLTTTVSILKEGIAGEPREGMRFETPGYRGAVTSVIIGASHYVLTLLATRR